MPYANNASLPDAVKKALPDDAQSIWREAFNGEFGKTSDESIAAASGWAAIKASGWSKDDSGIWSKKSSNSNEFDAEIFSTGTWNGDRYTEKDLDDMANNFYALQSKVKPPIKLGHESASFGKPGKFAIGWVKALKRKGNKLIATFAQVPDIVVNLIKSGRYKRVSAEVMWKYSSDGKIYDKVLAAVALLGADMPAVNNLADLEAYLSQSADNKSGLFERVAQYTLETDDNGNLNGIKEKKTMPDDEVKIYKEKAEAEEAAKKKAEQEAAEYKQKYEARVKADEEAAKKTAGEKFTAYCDDLVAKGKMSPGARDVLVKDFSIHQYSSNAGYFMSIDTFQKFMEKNAELDTKEYAKGKNKTGHGESFEDAGSEVDALARQYMAKPENKGVTYGQAVIDVLGSDVDLAARYYAYTDE